MCRCSSAARVRGDPCHVRRMHALTAVAGPGIGLMPASNRKPLSPLSILVVEDDTDTRRNLCDVLELDGYKVHAAASVAEMLAACQAEEFFAIVLDRKLPDGTADEVLPRLKSLAPTAAVFIVTGWTDLEGAISALQQGAADYIIKPLDMEMIRTRLARVAESRRVERALAQSEATLHAILQAVPCIIVIFAADRTVRYFSPFAERLTGYAAAEVLGQDCADRFLAGRDTRASVSAFMRRVLEGAPAYSVENCIRCKDGSLKTIIWNAQRMGDKLDPAVLAVGQDITNLKLAQEQALQSERLAAIGQMMAGLAHESRNALQRSQACLEMLSLEIRDRPAALDLLARLQYAQDHLHQLYEEVRGYAAPIHVRRASHDLKLILREAWDNLAVTRQGRTANLQILSGAASCQCHIDRLAMLQVFHNIFENSLSACSDPVEIVVELRSGALPPTQARAIRISIRDNGPGLDAAARERIFEPFFTTKTQGTGLGMAIVQRIVAAHGGRVAVGSSAGPGAEIIVTLPCEQAPKGPA